jgi:hypothetical protein
LALDNELLKYLLSSCVESKLPGRTNLACAVVRCNLIENIVGNISFIGDNALKTGGHEGRHHNVKYYFGFFAVRGTVKTVEQHRLDRDAVNSFVVEVQIHVVD